MRVLVVCAGGLSSSLLVSSMEKHARPGEVVEAHGEGSVSRFIHDVDVVLVAPQVAFKKDAIEALAKPLGVPVGLIPGTAYGMMDGLAAMTTARALLAADRTS